MIRVVIIDDEPKSIFSLVWEIENLPEEIEVVGKFDRGEDAIAEVGALNPDVIFLDIEMPGLDGFRFLEYFPNRKFEVVFVTGYAGHAIQAIRERAFDYLLKPVDREDLAKVMQRIREKSSQNTKLINSTGSKIHSKKLSINSDKNLILIDSEEVVYCESDGSYSYIHTENVGKLLVSKKLKILEDQLSDSGFYRVHHCFLINLQKVKSYDKLSGKVNLTGGVSIPVSRLKKIGFLESLK